MYLLNFLPDNLMYLWVILITITQNRTNHTWRKLFPLDADDVARIFEELFTVEERLVLVDEAALRTESLGLVGLIHSPVDVSDNLNQEVKAQNV